MATQTIQFRSPPSQTVTLRLFVAGSDTQISSAAATEATNRKGTYTAAFTDVPAAEYQYIATIGTSPIIPVASGYVLLTLTTATFQVYDAAKAVNLSEVVVDPGAIADAVWDEQYSQHTTAGTFGKLFDIWRKSNPAIDGVVTASVTPTTTTFSTNITGYPSGAFIHSVLLFVNGSTNAESNSPIIGYVSANGVITLEEPMQAAVQVGDEFVIAANSHVHPIASIAAGIWNSLLATYQAVGSFGKTVGDTKADTTTLLSTLQGSTVIQVASPNVSGNLVLTQGDTYDGIGNPKAQWNVLTDYTSGWAVVLTIRDKDDAVIYTNTGTVVSATLISVAIVVPTVTPFEGCPGQWQGKFDVQLTKASSVVTIAIGVVYINEDQTR
jgi:hypothetical protein